MRSRWWMTACVCGVLAFDRGPATADDVCTALDQADIHAVEVAVDVDEAADIVQIRDER